jgi:putative GTP pyrophosphokinase
VNAKIELFLSTLPVRHVVILLYYKCIKSIGERRKMYNPTLESFYINHYSKIKNTEKYLIEKINRYLEPLNASYETKLVEHVVARIKTPESTMEKLQLAGYDPTEENAISILSDVIGIRLIVHFIGDIYVLRNVLVNSGQFEIIKEKDYVRHAKPTGYRGYHIIIATNIDGFKIKAEIQLRTIAMDCWASLEHQIRYKKNIKNSNLINFELKKCSDDLMSADIAMEQILSMVRDEMDDIKVPDEFFDDAMQCAQQAMPNLNDKT